MTRKLASVLHRFPGPANRVRCFAHIVNLVAKIILRQFDLSKSCAKQAEDDLDGSDLELSELSDDTGDDSEIDEGDIGENKIDEGDIDDDADMESELAEVEMEMREEIDDMANSTAQFGGVLQKVSAINFHYAATNSSLPLADAQLRKFAYAVTKSPTKLMPEWNKAVKGLPVRVDDSKQSHSQRCIMPRDVPTRWNSTYEMLKFAYTYQDAINQLTDNRSMKLGHCVITQSEWVLIKQLRDALKVSIGILITHFH